MFEVDEIRLKYVQVLKPANSVPADASILAGLGKSTCPNHFLLVNKEPVEPGESNLTDILVLDENLVRAFKMSANQTLYFTPESNILAYLYESDER